MSNYKLFYRLEDYSNVDESNLKNKDEVINHLMWLLSQHEPDILEVTFPDGSRMDYSQGASF